jgi:S-adenosylmethionine:tRNA-ribosyltransferase-isomerase (queuine synthetase)
MMKKVLVVNVRESTIDIESIDDLPDFFEDNDKVVVNNALPLHGCFKTISPMASKPFDIVIRKHLKDDLFLVRTPSRIRNETRIYIGEFFECIGDVIDSVTHTERIVRFYGDLDQLNKGNVYLPKYIGESEEVNLDTHYGSEPMCAGSPTAGLNLDRFTCAKMELKGVEFVEMTSEVSKNNYVDVTRKNIDKLIAPAEEFIITQDAAEDINSGNRICCVGISTVKGMVRSLCPIGKVRPMMSSSNRFLNKLDYPFDMYFGNLERGNTTGKIFQKSFGEIIDNAYDVAKYHALQFGILGDSILIIK